MPHAQEGGKVVEIRTKGEAPLADQSLTPEAADSPGAAQSVPGLISQHRDWRIETAEPEKSVVFQSGRHAGGQLSPLSGLSAQGATYLPAFYALSAAIEKARREYVLLSQSEGRQGGEPRSFAVNVQGIRCRVQRVSDSRFHVRIPSALLPMSRMGMPEALKSYLLSHELDSGGLVVVCGSYGSGKTNTVNAVVRERIDRRGGYGLVLGNPIEYEYAGFHGSNKTPGFVEQVNLVGLDVAAEIRASMRNFPSGATSILAYPELIGHEGVGEMLRAANRGNLVFADMHALNIDASLLNLVSMGEQDGERYSRELLGNALRLVIHQRMSVMPEAARGVHVSFTHVRATRTLKAMLVDTAMPLSKVLAQPLGGE